MQRDETIGAAKQAKQFWERGMRKKAHRALVFAAGASGDKTRLQMYRRENSVDFSLFVCTLTETRKKMMKARPCAPSKFRGKRKKKKKKPSSCMPYNFKLYGRWEINVVVVVVLSWKYPQRFFCLSFTRRTCVIKVHGLLLRAWWQVYTREKSFFFFLVAVTA